MTGDADAQGAGLDLEDQRGVELHRLAVDADLHGAARVDAELRCRPLEPAREAVRAPRGLEGDETAEIGCTRDAGGDDAQHAEIDPLAGSAPRDGMQLVRIVRD